MTKDEVIQQISELQKKIEALPCELDIVSVEIYKFRGINRDDPYVHNVFLHNCIGRAAAGFDVGTVDVVYGAQEIELTFSANDLVFVEVNRRPWEETVRLWRECGALKLS